MASENILQENAVSIVNRRRLTLGKLTCVEGKTKSGGPSKTPQSVSGHKTQQLCWWGGRFWKGVRGGTDSFSWTWGLFFSGKMSLNIMLHNSLINVWKGLCGRIKSHNPPLDTESTVLIFLEGLETQGLLGWLHMPSPCPPTKVLPLGPPGGCGQQEAGSWI